MTTTTAGIAGLPRRRLNRSLAIVVTAIAFGSLLTAGQPAQGAGAREPVDAHAGLIYWSNTGTPEGNSVARLNGSGGGNLPATGATVDDPYGVALDPAAGRIYWPNYKGSTISYTNFAGTGGGQLATGAATVDGPSGIAVDQAAGRVYWANFNGDTISFAKLNGTGGGDLSIGSADINKPFGIAVDPAAGRVYWPNYQDGTISFAKLDGSGGGTINTTGATVYGPVGVAVDPVHHRIYWANALGESISYANLNGTGGGDLFTTGATVDTPEGVALDLAAGRIYWANEQGTKLSFAHLDGTGGGDLATTGATTASPEFPTLLDRPSGTKPPKITGARRTGSRLHCSTGSWAPDAVPENLYQAPHVLRYQWTRNHKAIAHATHKTVKAKAAGRYQCRVTAANAAGLTVQTSAKHTIRRPPRKKHHH